MPLRTDVLEALRATLDDRRVSRSERRAVRAMIADRPLTPDERAAVEAEVFDTVRDRLRDPRDRELIEWLRRSLPLLRPADVPVVESACYFGPGDPMVETLAHALGEVRRTVDVAVFTITDDRLSDALTALHRRGVRVRVLTDDDKAYDSGSDAHRLARAGLDVVFDQSPHHFHHKFAVLDGSRLINGSYNWTRGADRNNRENFMITNDPRLVARYVEAFEALWNELG